MATQKKVRGHRGNKPNDSFGTVNDSNLYRGNYRKDVYEDDDDDTPQEVEAVDAESNSEESTNESFATTKAETSPEHDYKKRYDDLKRHYDEKLKEFQQKEAALEQQTKQNNVRLPKTAEELENFKQQYPDVYGVVETVAAMQASERTTELQKEIEALREKEKNLEVQTAYRELKNVHPDFDELRKDEKFLAWLEEQPKNISDGIYKNNTDVKWAARVIDLYKVDAGITTKKKKTSTDDAAVAVTAPRARDIASENDGNKRIWKASQIAKMKPWEFEKNEAEIDAARAEGRIDYQS